VRVVSWNVNGIRACWKKGFRDSINALKPEIICLQETKASSDQLDADILGAADWEGRPYRCYWASAVRKGYSGTAILSRREPDRVACLGDAAFDSEGRLLTADFGDLSVISAYFPNSQDGGARLPYKLDFCKAVLDLCRRIVGSKRRVLLCGDYNIAHKPIDLAHPDANEGNPGYLPEERAWMDEFLGAGFVDGFRHFCDLPNQYTWWTYRVFGARERNIGWRLDYHCVDKLLAPRLRACAIHPHVMGSDHCPVSVDLDEEERK
jgi:exodeoxyribonuclease III